jgi:hypothetical protein
VPLDTAKDVFETCAKTLGGHLGAMQDGTEISRGFRRRH